MSEILQSLAEYGALVLFLVVFVEQIGLPVPAIPVLVAAGVLAGTGELSLWMAAGVTVSAALAADWIWYDLGRRRGRQVLDVLCRIALEPGSCVRSTEDFFIKHGPHSLVVAKFIPGLSTIAPPLAGIVGLGLPLFLLYDGLGALIWAGTGLGIGYAFSGQIDQAASYAEQVTPAVVILAISALAGYLGYKVVIRRRELRLVPRITVEQLTEKLRTDEPPFLIDVRPRERVVAEPGIPSAVWMSLEELTRRHHELPRQRDLVVYCGCPEDTASAQGTLLLNKQGFTRVWPLAGGIEAWHAVDSKLGAAVRLPASHAVSA